jgi:hypothetical protein
MRKRVVFSPGYGDKRYAIYGGLAIGVYRQSPNNKRAREKTVSLGLVKFHFGLTDLQIQKSRGEATACGAL